MVHFTADYYTVFCGPILYFLARNAIRDPTTGRRLFGFPKKRRGKNFTKNFLKYLKRLSHIFSHTLQKYPLQLDRMVHHDVTFLRISTRHFCDCTNSSLLFLCPLFDPCSFGSVIPNMTAKITCSYENRKPTMRTKQFPHFKIFHIPDQDSFSSLGAIPPSQDVAF